MKDRKYDIVFSLVLAAASAGLAFVVGVYAAVHWGIAKNPKTIIEYVPVTEKSTTTTVPVSIDLNTATIDDLIKIDGIGEKTAEKILAYREELGGFSFLEQLLDVNGIGETTLNAWRPYLTVQGANQPSPSATSTTATASFNTMETPTTTAAGVLRVNLNTASAKELMLIPGIGETTANKIIAYRDIIGQFVNLEQLLDIDGIGDKSLASWSKYLVLND